MVFNSLTFVIFMLVVLGVHYSRVSWTLKKTSLLIASYLFYSAWNPPLILLLVYSTVLDWNAGNRIAAATSPRTKKFWMWVSLVGNLGCLAFFKYANFITDSFASVVNAAGFEWDPHVPSILLPVGISFYTFQTLSYTIDIYRGDLKPARNLLDFSFFVTFFPQLVAGPIVRASDFLPQCDTEKRADERRFGWGLTLLVMGLVQKTVLADYVLAPVVEMTYAPGANLGLFESWLGTLAFSGQIFFDFAGYSTCAIGTAMCLGFDLTENFHRPYAAIGFSDFWRRWHMSLSTWLRDYLYISLGGNRVSKFRNYVNLSLTMLLGGLWHGASWNFVVWGGLHGGYLVAERLVRDSLAKVPFLQGRLGSVLGWALTYFAVCVAWVFFRAKDFPTAFSILGSMFGANGLRTGIVDFGNTANALTVVGVMLAVQVWLRHKSVEAGFAELPRFAQIGLLVLCLILLSIATGDSRDFIYFQF